VLIFGESDLYRVIKEYIQFFNQARPHQRLEQKIPEGSTPMMEDQKRGNIIAFPILNGLHHDYRRAA